MIEAINKYVLTAPFSNKHAGFSNWTFAKKDGKEYFIKEFLDPVYPMDGIISGEMKKSAILICKDFADKKKKLYSEINRASDGNTVRIEEFFRRDNHYYVVSERIQGPKLSPKELQAYPYEKRVLLCKTIAHSLMKIHQAHIVHADIKHTNIMFHISDTGNIIGKLIDFDCSFFESDPPAEGEDLGGDQVYMSPEACTFIYGEQVPLTCKMDVFALGILFHQYLTGELPGFDTDEYDYACDAVLDGAVLSVSPGISSDIRPTLIKMLDADPNRRPSMIEVYDMFGGQKISRSVESFTIPETVPEPEPEPETETEPEPVNETTSPDRVLEPKEKKKHKNPEDYFFVVE